MFMKFESRGFVRVFFKWNQPTLGLQSGERSLNLHLFGESCQ